MKAATVKLTNIRLRLTPAKLNGLMSAFHPFETLAVWSLFDPLQTLATLFARQGIGESINAIQELPQPGPFLT